MIAYPPLLVCHILRAKTEQKVSVILDMYVTRLTSVKTTAMHSANTETLRYGLRTADPFSRLNVVWYELRQHL